MQVEVPAETAHVLIHLLIKWPSLSISTAVAIILTILMPYCVYARLCKLVTSPTLQRLAIRQMGNAATQAQDVKGRTWLKHNRRVMW
jgi:hypothetical protein